MRLHILHHTATGEVHGAWMAEELARHGYKISPGRLYPMLHKMEAEGLLRSRPDVVDGRARRSYIATPKGRRALARPRSNFESWPASSWVTHHERPRLVLLAPEQ